MAPPRDRNDEPTERVHHQRPEPRISVPSSLLIALVTAGLGIGGTTAAHRYVASPPAITRDEFAVVIRRLEHVESRAEELRNGATRADTRLDAMDRKLDKMDGKLDQLVERRR